MNVIKTARKAVLHRFVAASAAGRYHSLNENTTGGMISLDIAFPRNEKDWFVKLPEKINSLIDIEIYYGHLFCHVMHLNYIVKKDVDPELLKTIANLYLYRSFNIRQNIMLVMSILVKPSLSNFYKKIGPY